MKLLLKPKEVADLLSVGNTKFYEEIVKDETFPKPVIIGRTKYYRYADIEEWVRGLQASA